MRGVGSGGVLPRRPAGRSKDQTGMSKSRGSARRTGGTNCCRGKKMEPARERSESTGSDRVDDVFTGWRGERRPLSFELFGPTNFA